MKQRRTYFCLAYAAARLAERYGVIPWSWETSSEAVKTAYAAHQALQGRVVKPLNLISPVRQFIIDHRTKFVDVRADRPALSRRELESGPGFITTGGGGEDDFAFARSHFQSLFGSDGDAEPTLQALKAAGLLKHDKGKLSTKRPIRSNAGRDRVYCIRGSILGAKDRS